MFGYFKRLTNRIYDGRATSDTDLGNGQFVALNEDANGVKAVVTGATPTTIPFMVCNVDESQPEEGISTVDMVVKAGKKLRLKQPASGDVLCTSAIKTGVTLTVGTIYAIHNGEVDVLAGGETPVQSYVLIEPAEKIDTATVGTFRVL